MTPERLKFLEDRRLGIGGSDVAAIFGISPWKTPFDLYLEKINKKPIVDNTEDEGVLYWGSQHEVTIATHYERKHGVILTHPKEAIVNEAYPWLRANVDGLIGESKVIFEAKTAYYGAAKSKWGEEGSDDVPLPYILQLLHYMIVTGFTKSVIALLINGCEYREYIVNYDNDIGQEIISRTHDFWFENVQKKIPPPLTNRSDALSAWPQDTSQGEIASTDILHLIESISESKADAKKNKISLEELTDKLIIEFGNNATFSDDEGRILATYKTVGKSRRLEIKI